ncbi:MAG: AzlC family ABC transporter permease [Paracoccaceae bacterium]
MTGKKASGFGADLRAGVPVAVGYFPIAFSFGVAAPRAGLSPFEATALSVIIHAGASQFLALAPFTSGAPVLVPALTLVAMKVRHALCGPALLKEAGRDAPTRHAWAWAWGLTDEVFGAT